MFHYRHLQPSSSSSPETALLCADQSSNTTPCCRKLQSTFTPEITSLSAQLQESSSVLGKSTIRNGCGLAEGVCAWAWAVELADTGRKSSRTIEAFSVELSGRMISSRLSKAGSGDIVAVVHLQDQERTMSSTRRSSPFWATIEEQACPGFRKPRSFVPVTSSSAGVFTMRALVCDTAALIWNTKARG